MKKGVIKLLIADDHDLIRLGLRRIIGFEDDIDVLAEAENGEEILNMIDFHKPNMVLLDINMPFVNGIEVLKKVKSKYKDIKTIMLTIENDRKTIHTAIDIGADGYVLKDSAGTEIVNAIRTVWSGEKYIDKHLVSLLFSDIRNKGKFTHNALDVLSKREVEVLINIAKGLSNKEIGQKLYISEKTVKNYATNLFRKINVNDRVQATIFAIENKAEEYFKSNL